MLGFSRIVAFKKKVYILHVVGKSLAEYKVLLGNQGLQVVALGNAELAGLQSSTYVVTTKAESTERQSTGVLLP